MRRVSIKAWSYMLLVGAQFVAAASGSTADNRSVSAMHKVATTSAVRKHPSKPHAKATKKKPQKPMSFAPLPIVAAQKHGESLKPVVHHQLPKLQGRTGRTRIPNGGLRPYSVESGNGSLTGRLGTANLGAQVLPVNKPPSIVSRLNGLPISKSLESGGKKGPVPGLGGNSVDRPKDGGGHVDAQSTDAAGRAQAPPPRSGESGGSGNSGGGNGGGNGNSAGGHQGGGAQSGGYGNAVKQERLSNGSTRLTYSDGTTSTHFPDGTTVVRRPDGTTITGNETGARVVHYPDGSGKIVYPDGTTRHYDSSGNFVTTPSPQTFEQWVKEQLKKVIEPVPDSSEAETDADEEDDDK